MIKTAPSALKKHFDNDIKNVKHSVMQKLVDEKKISQSVYDTLKKQKMKYNKDKKVAPAKKPAVKKPPKPTMTDVLMNYDMDVNKMIGKATKGTNEWYMAPVQNVIAGIYKSGKKPEDVEKGVEYPELQKFAVGSLSGEQSKTNNWVLVYRLVGNTMVDVHRVSYSELHREQNKMFKMGVKKYLQEEYEATPFPRGIDGSKVSHLKSLPLNSSNLLYKTTFGHHGAEAKELPSWWEEGFHYLKKRANDADKDFISKREPELKKMKVKELKEMISPWNRNSKDKKSDLIKKILYKEKPS